MRYKQCLMLSPLLLVLVLFIGASMAAEESLEEEPLEILVERDVQPTLDGLKRLSESFYAVSESINTIREKALKERGAIAKDSLDDALLASLEGDVERGSQLALSAKNRFLAVFPRLMRQLGFDSFASFLLAAEYEIQTRKPLPHSSADVKALQRAERYLAEIRRAVGRVEDSYVSVVVRAIKNGLVRAEEMPSSGLLEPLSLIRKDAVFGVVFQYLLSAQGRRRDSLEIGSDFWRNDVVDEYSKVADLLLAKRDVIDADKAATLILFLYLGLGDPYKRLYEAATSEPFAKNQQKALRVLGPFAGLAQGAPIREVRSVRRGSWRFDGFMEYLIEIARKTESKEDLERLQISQRCVVTILAAGEI